MEDIATAFQMLADPFVLIVFFLAVVISQIFVVIPGLGGSFTLVMVLPFAITMEPVAGIALLLGTMVATGTGNTVTSVFFGVPGSAMGVAAVFDGYPMAKKGEGARALSAGVTASVLGGLIGAVGLAIIIPIIRPVVLAFGPAEFFMLTVVAIFMISYIGQTSTARGMVAGGLGLLCGMIGQGQATAELRFTFGQLYLWDGLGIVPVVVGLFALAEMILLLRKGGKIAEGEMQEENKGGLFQGALDVFRHWKATLQSTFIGFMVGLMPGMGGVAAQFLGYGYVAKTHRGKTKVPFGEGAIEGVIAADAPTNSKDGGGFIVTLAFGIPGGVSFAIALGAFIALGVTPGRSLLLDNMPIVYLIVIFLVLGELISGGMVLAFVNQFAKLAFMPVAYLIPIIIVASLMGAYAATNHIGAPVVAVIFGLIGYFFVQGGYSRAVFIIAYVLSSILEHNLFLAYNIYGFGMFLRPITLGIMIFLTVGIALGMIRRLKGKKAPQATAETALQAQKADKP